MNAAQYSYTASLLTNEQVLVADGCIHFGITSASVELYDPSSGTWATTNSMHGDRRAHTASVLSNGKVLVTDGREPKSFAITAWSDIPKETVLDAVKQEFGIENIQYICIAEEIGDVNHQRHLHIQIIFKRKVDRRRPFLDHITQTHCNYQVTSNDLAWNEYIKKEGDFIEFNTFESPSVRGQKQWSLSSSSSSSAAAASTSSVAITAPVCPQISSTATTTPAAAAGAVAVQDDTSIVAAVRSRSAKANTTTVRAQAEQRRQVDRQIAQQAFTLAEKNVDQAMDLIKRKLPSKFATHSSWYLHTFNYIHLRAQQEADRRGDIDKEYVWPHSFPDCTHQLQEVVNRWIDRHFSRTKRAKCLILIGPIRTGKTSFAMSLPGCVNYFKGRWNLDAWNDYARYSVYDDIPRDQFDNLNYPNKKNLLTQNGKTNATDKYRGTKTINVQQPAIVLLNPEDAGSLLRTPTTDAERNAAEYWEQNAIIYRMGSDEYFHRHRPQTRSQGRQATQNIAQASTGSSTTHNQQRQNTKAEFERMYQRYREKHPQ